jgi:hypothetical protein
MVPLATSNSQHSRVVNTVCSIMIRRTRALRFVGELRWFDWLLPSDCIVGGDMSQLLLLQSLAPLAVILSAPLIGCAVSLVRHLLGADRPAQMTSWRTQNTNPKIESLRHKAMLGLISGLPVSLLLTFCFTPSVSASVFRAWYCIPYTWSELEERSYLAEDVRIRCDGSPEHNNILTIAWPMVVIWPIGSVLVCVALLMPCRAMILEEASSSPLMHATAFLHRDFKPV